MKKAIAITAGIIAAVIAVCTVTLLGIISIGARLESEWHDDLLEDYSWGVEE